MLVLGYKGIVGALALRTRGGGLKESFATGELSPLAHAFLTVKLPTAIQSYSSPTHLMYMYVSTGQHLTMELTYVNVPVFLDGCLLLLTN